MAFPLNKLFVCVSCNPKPNLVFCFLNSKWKERCSSRGLSPTQLCCPCFVCAQAAASAWYAGGSGTRHLLFAYDVRNGDGCAAGGLGLMGGILNGSGTILRAADSPTLAANLSLHSLGYTLVRKN